MLVVLGVVLSALSLVGRARMEMAPSPVEIALEWGDAVRSSSAQRVPLARWLASMRHNGARGITLDVQTVRDLAEDGRLTLWSRAGAAPFFPQVAHLPAAYCFVISCPDAALFKRVRASLNEGTGEFAPVPLGTDTLAVVRSNLALQTWPVGLDPLALREVRGAGMEPLARLGDWVGLTPARLDAVLRAAKHDGARIIVAGDPAPGNATLLPEFARLLRKNRLSLAWVEGEPTRGTPVVARESRGFVVRTHVVSSLDTLRLEPGEMVDRFARAARERNVRLYLVRLPRQLSGEADADGRFGRDSWAQQRDFVAALAGETRENRWRVLGRPTLPVGLAKRFGVGNRSEKKAGQARFGAGIAVVGASLLLVGLFVPLSGRAVRDGTLFGLALVAVLHPFAGFGAQVLALGASLTFPILALAWSGLGRRGGIRMAGFALLRATAISLAGGLVVAATLDDWTYWSKVADFWGTKAAAVGPVAGVLLLLLGEFWPGANPRRCWIRARRRAKALGRRAFPLRDIGLAALAGGVVALWLARSGNDSGVAVSALEWKFRALLETLFVARPRTKEFSLCHPALVMGALLLPTRRRHLAWPLLALGAIGQISVVNSFAQANNPLYIATWRSLLALLLGGALGLLLAWASAPRLGLARVQGARRPFWTPATRRLVWGAAALVLALMGGRWFTLKRRYAALVAPSQGTVWPWPNARPETLRRGVTHRMTVLDDGTTLDLLRFDWKANPRLRLGLWDADVESSPDRMHPRNRFAYWQNGFASQAGGMNARGELVACWNAGFFGLLNRKPRTADRAFHLSPIVSGGRAYYSGRTHRWTWGAKMGAAGPTFKLEHEPPFANLARDFDCATGTLQGLITDGHPLALRPYPWFGETPQAPPIPSTPEEAGHIPMLDWMHTARTSAGWDDAGHLWVLVVKEPDGEAPSRELVRRRERGRGGWTLADVQRFWLALGVPDAVGFDGGDVAQAAWRRADGSFEVLAPRLTLPPKQSATLRLRSDSTFQTPAVRALHGSALSFFWVREVRG